jgi:hypothetical protein
MNVKRTRALLALVAASAALPGCYAATTMFRTDSSGMGETADWASDVFRDQCRRTGDRITGFPASLDAHFQDRWRLMTTPYPVGR